MRVKHITAPYDPKRTIPQIVIRYSKDKNYIVVVRRNIEGVEGRRIIPITTGDQIELKISKEFKFKTLALPDIYEPDSYGEFETSKWCYWQLLFPNKGKFFLVGVYEDGSTQDLVKFLARDAIKDKDWRWSRIPADAPFIVVAGSYGGFAGLGSSRKSYGLRRWLRDAKENGSYHLGVQTPKSKWGGFREIPGLASWGAGCKLYQSQQFVPFRQPFVKVYDPVDTHNPSNMSNYSIVGLDHDWSMETLAAIRHAEKLGFRMMIDFWDIIGSKDPHRQNRNPLNHINNIHEEIVVGKPFWRQEILTDRNSLVDKHNYSLATRMGTIDNPWGPGAYAFGELMRQATINYDNLIPRGHIRVTGCEMSNPGFEKAVIKILHRNGHRGPICWNNDHFPWGKNDKVFTDATLEWPEWKQTDLIRAHQAWDKETIQSLFERHQNLFAKHPHMKIILDDDGAATRPLRGYYEHNKFADIKMMHEVVNYARELFGDRLYAFVFKIALGPEFNADADYVLKGY